jgi:hypothetical protein
MTVPFSILIGNGVKILKSSFLGVIIAKFSGLEKKVKTSDIGLSIICFV